MPESGSFIPTDKKLPQEVKDAFEQFKKSPRDCSLYVNFIKLLFDSNVANSVFSYYDSEASDKHIDSASIRGPVNLTSDCSIHGNDLDDDSNDNGDNDPDNFDPTIWTPSSGLKQLA